MWPAIRPTARVCRARLPPLDGSKIANGAKAEHINIVMNGKTGTAMAAFKHLSDVQIAAVVTYERNSWGNSRET